MKKTSGWLLIYLAAFLPAVYAQTVSLTYSKLLPQAYYAAGTLEKSLLKQGYLLKQENADFIINLAIDSNDKASESYAIERNGNKVVVKGGDERGLIYGSLALAESLRNGMALKDVKAVSEKPHYLLRAIKFDLPWDTYRHSYALDLHMETCKDVNYWKAFLDMMVENRFNALSLWNLHPYTFMIRPKNFPEASPFNVKEMKQWQDLYHAIFRMAKERAIDIYIVPFNIFVSAEFSRAHKVSMDNLAHHFFVKGDTTEIVKKYTRECVTQMLKEYPEITGMGLTLGEGMGDMTPEQREDWMRQTIIEGMRLTGRPLKLIHRIPFSSTTGSLGVTSIETEKLTRKAIEEEGNYPFLIKPVFADLKYNWSHAHSTPKLIKVHGGKLFDTYFKPDPSVYKITWTARNEDFFCLRWGVPDFVRAHIANNNQDYVGGYFVGSETYIPAKDYFTKSNIAVDWKYAFERQWLFYKIWGRLLYNPATPDAIFQSEFVRRYGKQGVNLLQASSLVGKTPLRLASLFDFTMDLTLYTEGFMALDNNVKRVEYISLDRLIAQPVTDTDYVSVSNYVTGVLAGSSFGNKITPIALARMLRDDCNKALELVKFINTAGNNALMFEVEDIKAWGNMGLHLAEKLEAAVALQTYRLKGGEENRQGAVFHMENALRYWDAVVYITRPIYNDMPLVHYSEQNGVRSKENANDLRFHWQKLRRDVVKDLETAQGAKQSH